MSDDYDPLWHIPPAPKVEYESGEPEFGTEAWFREMSGDNPPREPGLRRAVVEAFDWAMGNCDLRDRGLHGISHQALLEKRQEIRDA